MNAFGTLLRDWRATRRFSQLELSLTAGASARHISFLESGRARPSRDMVLRLARSLELPPAVTNGALAAAGFAPLYPSLQRDDPRLAVANDALRVMLDNHDPLPAVVFDAGWDVVDMNAAAGPLLGMLGLARGDNIIDALIELPARDGPLDNWGEVATLLALRLRTEIAHGGDQTVLAPLLDRLRERITESGDNSTPHDPESVVVPLRLALGDQRLSLVTMLAQFGGIQEIAMAGLRIELYFAGDDATRRYFSQSR